jgi:hypothetical protein
MVLGVDGATPSTSPKTPPSMTVESNTQLSPTLKFAPAQSEPESIAS